MNSPRKGYGQDPEEGSRGVDAVIVVSAAFLMNSNRGPDRWPAPEELNQRRYFDRERKRRSDEHRSNPVGRGRIDLSFATREDLSLKNGPDSCRPGRGEFRVDVFLHLIYILFADDSQRRISE